ncbi:MAG TPA: glycosyltransferase 87 family protein [Solirubrobacteraceae bacterium]|nr:glycosyltransferase 87 family protein [Solirubrobacteraceae bacterium]
MSRAPAPEGSGAALGVSTGGRASAATARPAAASRRLLALAVVFVLCAAGLSLLHARTQPHYRLGAAAAIAAARANPSDREFLASHPASSARVVPLDATVQRVTFFDGPRIVLDAAVGPNGALVSIEQHIPGEPVSGAALANSPWVLALLTVLFLLATLVMPLQRVRNLDALAVASFTLTVPLINEGLAVASVALAVPALCYLLIRCLLVGLGSTRPPASPTTPLLQWLWADWEPRRRTRMLRVLLFATVLAFLLITLTSSGYSDVAVASLQGATDLLHGVLPYGHMQLEVHGDTYPLLNYLFYAPAAAWLPVRDLFSDMSGSLLTTAVASLLVGWALFRLGGRAPAGGGRADERTGDRGLRLALAWFAFPPVLLAASGGSNDLVLAACLAGMLALRPRIGASLLALALGVWVKLVPLVLLPIWLPYRRRGLGRACYAAVALSAGAVGLLVLFGGLGGVSAMVHAMTFQFQRGSFYTPWYAFGLRWLQPLVQAAVLAIVVAAVLALRSAPSAGTDLVRLGALAAALLLGVQLAANYWTWSYLPWVFPFLAVALFLGAPAPVGLEGDAVAWQAVVTHPLPAALPAR